MESLVSAFQLIGIIGLQAWGRLFPLGGIKLHSLVWTLVKTSLWQEFGGIVALIAWNYSHAQMHDPTIPRPRLTCRPKRRKQPGQAAHEFTTATKYLLTQASPARYGAFGPDADHGWPLTFEFRP